MHLITFFQDAARVKPLNIDSVLWDHFFIQSHTVLYKVSQTIISSFLLKGGGGTSKALVQNMLISVGHFYLTINIGITMYLYVIELFQLRENISLSVLLEDCSITYMYLLKQKMFSLINSGTINVKFAVVEFDLVQINSVLY